MKSEAPGVGDERSSPTSERDETLRASLALALYEAHAEELRRFLLGVVRDRHIADDLAQNAFAKLIAQGQAVRPETSKSWLFQVGYREALAWKRKQASRNRAYQQRLQQTQENDLNWTEPADETLTRNERIQEVRQALDELPDDQRAVVIARIHEGRTFAEIADSKGLSLGTVATRMRLALEKLRKRLGSGDSDRHD